MSLNLYGDSAKSVAHGRGHDIASQRSDALDDRGLAAIREQVATGQGVIAWDLGCGLGGHAIRMAQAGARVYALDVTDFTEAIDAACTEAGLPEHQLHFMQGSLLEGVGTLPSPHLISCQRTIHYFTAEQAQELVLEWAARLAPGGALYLSASGINSELAQDYAGATVPWAERYAPLAQPMADKHDIRGPVCLYAKDDLEQVLLTAGLTGIEVFESPFGNIKAVAYKK